MELVQTVLRRHYRVHHEITQEPRHIKTLLVTTEIKYKQVRLERSQNLYAFGLQSHKIVPDKF